jgi:hypothetical protein
MARLPNANTVTRKEWLTTPGALQPKLFPHVHMSIAQIWPD